MVDLVLVRLKCEKVPLLSAMKRTPEQGKIDLFRRLDFAVISFRQSLALCEHLIEVKITATRALVRGH
jgi:hypothetical protein